MVVKEGFLIRACLIDIQPTPQRKIGATWIICGNEKTVGGKKHPRLSQAHGALMQPKEVKDGVQRSMFVRMVSSVLDT